MSQSSFSLLLNEKKIQLDDNQNAKGLKETLLCR